MKRNVFLGILGILLFSVAVLATSDLGINSITSPVGNPGDSVMVDAVVANAGIETIQTVLFTSTDLISGSETIVVNSPGILFNLGAGEERTHSFGVTLPALPAGVYTGTLTATDSSDAQNTDSLTYSVTVNAIVDVEITEEKLEIDLQEGQSGSDTFTIENQGSLEVSTLAYAHDLTLEDGDGDKITLTFGEFDNFAPGESETITLTAEAEDGIDFGEYSGEMTISANNGADTDSFELTISVLPDLCDEGVVGNDLKITIEEPDDGEEYAPGEEIDLEINVENNGNDDYDVGVEVFLYSDDDKLESEKLKATNIDEDEDEDFEVTIQIPTDPDDISDGDTLTIFVIAYDDDDEDELCVMESIEIEIELEDEDVGINKLSLSPNTAKPGELVDVVAEVMNFGSDDDEDVYLEVKNSQLGISERTESFELAEFDDEDDNSATKRVNFKVPDNAEDGTYNLIVTVFYAGGESRSKSIDLIVEGGSSSNVPGVTTPSTLLVTTDSSYSTEAGSSITIPVTIKNRGNQMIIPEISVKGIGLWADLFGIDQLSALQPEEQSVAYVYLTVKDGITGSQSLTIEVNDGSETASTKQVSVDVGATEEGPSFTGRVTGWFEDSESSSVFWIIGDIVLIIIALFFLKMLFSSKRKRQN